MTRMPRCRALAVASAGALAPLLFLVACSSSGPQAGSQGANASHSKAPRTVTIAYITGNDALPETIARNSGYFNSVDRQFNTTVQFQTYNSPTPVIAGLASGQIQFAVFTLSNGILSAVQGKPLTDVVNLGQGFNGEVVGKASESRSKGTGLNALKKSGGATIAITSLGGVSQVACDVLLKAAGVDISSIKYVAVGSTGVIPAVGSGRAALGFAGLGPALAGEAAGQTYNVLFSSGKSAFGATGFQPAFGLQALPTFVQQYPELTQALVDAEMKGLEFLKKNAGNPSAIYPLMDQSYRATTTLQSFTNQFPLSAAISVPVTGVINLSGVKDQTKLLQDYKLVPSSFAPPASMIDTGFVEQYYKSAGQPVPTSGIDVAVMNTLPS